MKKNRNKAPIERVEADLQQGLTAAQVEERVKKGYVNISEDPNEKSTLKIIASNTFMRTST